MSLCKKTSCDTCWYSCWIPLIFIPAGTCIQLSWLNKLSVTENVKVRMILQTKPKTTDNAGGLFIHCALYFILTETEFSWNCIYWQTKYEFLPLRKIETSSSWGTLSSLYPQYLVSRGKFFKYSRQAWVG